MAAWERYVSAVGGDRVISLLGGFAMALAVVRIVLLRRPGVQLSVVLASDLVIAIPGIVLLYGGYRLSDTDLRPDVYPRIVARCFAGIGVMLGVVLLLAVSTGLNRPIFTPMIATALGAVGGFGVGVNEARAVSRARDAEERRDELRRERDLRERIVDTSPVGIVVVDPDGAIRSANEHAAEIVGLPPDELTEFDDPNHPMFEATDSEGNRVDDDSTVFRRILATDEPVYDVERQLTSADGERIWISVNGAPLRAPSGDVDAVVLAFEDVTERKQLEDELKETVERLEESNRRLSESNERLEEFAYAASHDLQEPLRMVSSYLQLLEGRYTDELDEEAEEFIEFAVDGADRMRSMIESLLEYSRVTHGGEPLEPTDAGAVLEDVLDDLQLQIEETDATVTVEELPTVTADADQLAQVFRNLIENALRYSGDAPPEVSVHAERRDDEVEFVVADEGVGIDPELHDRIFTVFERVHADDEPGAEGIGLALCDRIVERHGGEIRVESEPGEGATFRFTIPLPEADRSVPGGHPRDGG
jgi:PAS domain S-box-containing protein